MFLCVKSLESRLACSKSLINVSCVAGGGEHTALGGASNHGGHRGAVCSVSWVGSWSVPLLPFPGGDSALPSLLAEGHLAVCVPCASQPGIGDLEEEERKGGFVADLGNTRVLYSKDGPSARSRVADVQLPEQGANGADLVSLALRSVGRQMGKGHQPAS